MATLTYSHFGNPSRSYHRVHYTVQHVRHLTGEGVRGSGRTSSDLTLCNSQVDILSG